VGTAGARLTNLLPDVAKFHWSGHVCPERGGMRRAGLAGKIDELGDVPLPVLDLEQPWHDGVVQSGRLLFVVSRPGDEEVLATPGLSQLVQVEGWNIIDPRYRVELTHGLGRCGRRRWCGRACPTGAVPTPGGSLGRTGGRHAPAVWRLGLRTRGLLRRADPRTGPGPPRRLPHPRLLTRP
jgi:hypothetical protein